MTDNGQESAGLAAYADVAATLHGRQRSDGALAWREAGLARAARPLGGRTHLSNAHCSCSPSGVNCAARAETCRMRWTSGP